MGAVVRLASAARLGEVRVGAVVWCNWKRHIGFVSDDRMHDFDWSSAKVQAAYIRSSSFLICYGAYSEKLAHLVGASQLAEFYHHA